MKNLVLTGSIVLASFAWGGVAYACDMHGGGYGFGMRNAHWKSYSPPASNLDSDFSETTPITPLDTDVPPDTILQEDGLLQKEAVPPKKIRPSFSNVASLAANRAKTALAAKEAEQIIPADTSDGADVKTELKKQPL